MATDSSPGVLARARRAVDRAQGSRPGRAIARYSVARGGLLAGGVAYSALFSIGAALTLAWTAFMTLLGRDQALRQRVIEAINATLPGILDAGDGGLLRPEDLVLTTALSPGSVLALVVLVWTALTVMSGLKSSIRAMFGIVAPPENVLAGKARDGAGFAGLAVGVLLTAVLGLAAGAAGQSVLGLVGVEGALAGWALRALGLAVAAAVDGAIFVMLVRVTAGVRPPRRDLLAGAALGALASGVLRVIGTTAVGAVDDPLLASFTALVTLLVWVNLLARLTLLVAAWTANPPAPVRPTRPEEIHLDDRPNYVTESEPATKAWPHQPVTGTVLPEPPETGQDSAEPHRPGLVGAWQRWRIARLERRLDRRRAAYRQGAELAHRAEPVDPPG